MKPIERITATDATIASIRELILSGEYDVNDKLPVENKLSEMLNVSRTTVREAIRVLQTLGYVKLLPGKGAFVACNTPIMPQQPRVISDVGYIDLMRVRIIVEPYAASMAVEKGSEKDIVELSEILSAFLKAVDSRDPVKMMLCDDQFHKQVFSMTGNNLMIYIEAEISRQNLKYRRESFTDDELYRNAVEPHKRIYSCIKNRDSKGAFDAMNEHMEMALRDINKMFNRQTGA